MKIDCINTMFNSPVDFLFDDDGGFFDDEGFVFDDDLTLFDFAYDTLYDKTKLIRHYIIYYINPYFPFLNYLIPLSIILDTIIIIIITLKFSHLRKH